MSSPASPVPTPLEVSARAFDALGRTRLASACDRCWPTTSSSTSSPAASTTSPARGRSARHKGDCSRPRPTFRVDVTRVAAGRRTPCSSLGSSPRRSPGRRFGACGPTGRRVRLFEGASTHVVREGQARQPVQVDLRRRVLRPPGRDAPDPRLRPPTGPSSPPSTSGLGCRQREAEAAAARRRRLRLPSQPRRRLQRRASVAPDELEDLLRQEELAVIATDLAGTVTHWSAGAERLYGLFRTEVIGRPITELTVGPEDAQVAENIMDCVRRTGRWEGEFWVRRRDGRCVPRLRARSHDRRSARHAYRARRCLG